LGPFEPFHYCTKDDAKLAELVPSTHPIHSIGPKTHVLGRLGPFCYGTKVDAKLAELAPLTIKFAKRSCVKIFRNKRA
jgi:hypothetical protein